MIFYTDGSCKPSNPGYCGCGVVVIDGEKIVDQISSFLGEGTNNIAELTAIKIAFEWIRSKGLEWESHTIYSDSNYAIGLLTKNWKASKNQELVADLRKLQEYLPNTSLIWVKGHNNEKYNELADKLANQAVDGGMIKLGA